MKISSVKVFVLRVPLGRKQFYSSQCVFPERNSLLVRVETASGLIGWGEGGQYGPCEPVAACVAHVFGPRLIGRSIHEAGRLWEEFYALTRDYGRKSAYVEALSAIDIALWDLRGRALGQPVSSLLGGAFRSSIFAYATGCYYRGDDVLRQSATLPGVVPCTPAKLRNSPSLTTNKSTAASSSGGSGWAGAAFSATCTPAACAASA